MRSADQRADRAGAARRPHPRLGATNKEIALRLGLREQTVKNRLSAIYGKLGLRNRLELAVYLARMAASEAAPSQN